MPAYVGELMTHDKLLAKIQSDYEENKHFRDEPKWKPFAALRAVVELHRPTEDGLWCDDCFGTPFVRYPCPTIQAIEKELS
jgi:hypothetical protein